MRLDSIPIFGYETSRYNANAHRLEEYQRIAERENRRGNPVMMAMNQADRQELIDKRMKKMNTQKFMGYIPIIGCIVGYNRVTQVMNADIDSLRKVVWILRGSLEFVSLGFLNAIPDLLATLYFEIREYQLQHA